MKSEKRNRNGLLQVVMMYVRCAPMITTAIYLLRFMLALVSFLVVLCGA